MARYTGAVCKKCRKLDTKLFLKGTKCFTSCVFEKRASKQGKGFKKSAKKSEYALHLQEKQRARFISGMTEKPFVNLFDKALRMDGQTGTNFLRLLETRLDNIVKRMGFAVSMRTARQIVLHGHIKVNGKDVNVPSYQIKPGDVVELDKEFAKTVAVKQGLDEANKRSTRPSFLEFDAAKNSGKLLRWPDRAECSYPVQEQLIVEYYSK